MTEAKRYNVVVAGAGAGGICAAVAAARSGAHTLLIEKAPEIGGTGVHSPVSLICKFHGTDHRPINLGIHRELFFEAYRFSSRDKRAAAPRLTYDEKLLLERYRNIVAAEPKLELRTGAGFTDATVVDRRIQSLTLEDGSVVEAPVFVDSTADGNLAAAAGCGSDLGRTGDGAMQSATLTFTVRNIDLSQTANGEFSTRGGLHALWSDLTDLLLRAKAAGQTANPKDSVVCFPYPDGQRLLFNANEVLAVDPTRPENLDTARAEGERYVHELFAILQTHPAFAGSEIEFISTKLGVREGRRIHADYTLTEQDCLGEARFDDMVAACAYEIDIHDPDGGPARMVDIPGSGYYHIPRRSLIARDLDNLALGSRCIGGTHEAHSSYRVITGVTAIGQAAGTSAALAARSTSGALRDVPVAEVQYVLREQLQFVEGDPTKPADWPTVYA